MSGVGLNKVFDYYKNIEQISFNEVELFKKYNNNEIDKDQIIANYYRFIIRIAYRFKNIHCLIPFDDCFSLAVIGFLRAIDDYNLKKGYKFLTLASIYAENEIKHALRRMRKHSKIFSLNTVIFEQKNKKEIVLEDFLKSDSDIESDVTESMTIKNILKCLNILSEREKFVLYKLYFEEMKQKDIAKILGVSQSYASRITIKAINKLRVELVKLNIADKSIIEKIGQKSESKRLAALKGHQRKKEKIKA